MLPVPVVTYPCDNRHKCSARWRVLTKQKGGFSRPFLPFHHNYFTTSCTSVVCCIEPDIATTVTVYVPTGVALCEA